MTINYRTPLNALAAAGMALTLGGAAFAESANYRVILPDTASFVATGGGGKEDLCDGTSVEEVWKFEGHSSSVYGVAVDGAGNVYSGSRDNTVRKIDPDGSEVWSFTGHSDRVYGVAVDGAGNVYSGSLDNTVRKIRQTSDTCTSG
ncbi:WD40 repeat, subgroup (plasmid) [Thioalkalivibrio sp. K90mix]|uniref:PQQ-binding-like beta-propeller repeat protein n=1 Tax=Thioalkalivibrio sp. (strain K90mix) TaxID=396595 RepID=UPI000195AB22|nr:PQQ-binding-like beta-propeller repeat protein [Thioalkalivibrio sp. K90mix]ADC73103.1 WD40 repeat, subgroup [Thioalkalivibrio sp. K90mix]